MRDWLDSSRATASGLGDGADQGLQSRRDDPIPGITARLCLFRGAQQAISRGNGVLFAVDGLGLTLTLVDLIGVSADGVFGGVGLTPSAGGLVGDAGRALEEGRLAALALGVDAVLVQAAGARDGGVVVAPLAAVLLPVVVVLAVVVDVAVAVASEDKAVLADLLSQGAVRAL